MTAAPALPETWYRHLGPAVRTMAPDDITISVVIPSYNHARFVRDAIASVDRQSYPYIQLVIIDDGSTDDSVKVIRKALRQISIRDVVFEVQANAGAHNAINRGVALARGACVTILNSDDLYHPERLARLYEFLHLNTLDLAFTQSLPWSDTSAATWHVSQLARWNAERARRPALSGALFSANLALTSSNLFFRRSLFDQIGGFKNLTLVHDWDFLLRASAEREPGMLDEPLLMYRIHEQSTLRRFRPSIAYAEYRAVLQDYFERARSGGIRNPAAPGHRIDSAFLDRLSESRAAAWFNPGHEALWRSSNIDFAPAHAAMTPPDELMRLVGSLTADNYHAVGVEFVRYFVELADLQPDAAVLDIGCGSGRIAISLTPYLSTSARYEGFDIVPAAIQWCSDTITPKFGNFRFQLADIRNSFYNPEGRVPAAEYAFPFPDATFDFVFLTSVFTHILPDELARYMAEISRVLKPGGRCLATFFLENEESLRCMSSAACTLPFTVRRDGYRSVSEEQPELAVCYPESAVAAAWEACGLTPQAAIHGSWCGRTDYLSYQDIFIVTKAASC